MKLLRLRIFALLLCFACTSSWLHAADSALVVPAFTAYAEPNPDALEISETNPITGWADAHTHIVWYGQIEAAGDLQVAVQLHLPAGETASVAMKVNGKEVGTRVVHGSADAVTAAFGSVRVPHAGPYRFELSGVRKSGATYGQVDALQLSGPATAGALFNLTPQRGAPSVHLNFPIPDGVQARWFYNEVTVKKDPVASYYEACGFARGYFGIQVNSPTERRIIFSVWDSGEEKVDRGKVAAQDRVQLLRKGDGVFASDFGNEGTGGHSHLVYPWKTGETYRFLVSAQPEGADTIYTGYFYFPEKHAWGLIASFRAPKDGGYLRHLYSFNEDFDGANGQMQRLAEFGDQWIKTTDDRWIELTKARFTHTAVGQYKDRIDRAAGVTGKNFYLTNGGFEPSSMKYGDELTRPANGQPPAVSASDLPSQP